MGESLMKRQIIFTLGRLPDDGGIEVQEALREIMKILDSLPPSMTDEEFMAMLNNAPEDDEEETEEERLAVEQARKEIREGKATPINDLLMKHGLL